MTTTQLSRYLIKQALKPMTHAPARTSGSKGLVAMQPQEMKELQGGGPVSNSLTPNAGPMYEEWLESPKKNTTPQPVDPLGAFQDFQRGDSRPLTTPLSELQDFQPRGDSRPLTTPLSELQDFQRGDSRPGAPPAGTLAAATGYQNPAWGVAPNTPAASIANSLGGTGINASIAGPSGATPLTVPNGSAPNAFQLPSPAAAPAPINPATVGANPYGAPQNPAPQATSATAAPWSAGRLGDPHPPIQQSRQPTSVENVTPQYDMESLSKMNEQDRHNFMMASMGHGYTEQNGAGTSKFFSPTGNGQVQQTATISPDANTTGKRNLTSIYGTGSATLGAPVGGPDRKTMVDGIPRFGDDPMRRSIVNPPAQGADLLPGEAWGKAAAKQAALHFALSCVKFAAAVANSPPIVSLHETPGSSPMAAKFTKTAPVVKEKIPLQVTV